ncbi:site-specific integrase [Aurantimonas marina]|uniref:site-specific integrase n=1 Tax=Aurantimonas marina TaxID=2780508 RepID=UPI0019D0893D|nr:site-specific integrase [Aurantimonas marina]
MPKLTKTIVDRAEPQAKQVTIWCSELKGFGIFIQPSGTRTYFVDYRNAEDVRRRMTIGRHGMVTCEEARKLAIAKLGAVVKGEDPAGERITRRQSLTVRELCKKYLVACDMGVILGKGNRPKKASTLYTDKGRINGHIIPLLGSRRVIDLKPADIKRFVKDVASGKTAKIRKTGKVRGKSIVRGGNGTATRTTGLLGGILSYAYDEGIIERNPAENVKRPAGTKKTRRLTPSEYRQLGVALATAKAEGETQQLLDGIRLLALTGCRLGEIVNLKWTEVDEAAGALRFDDSKEGASVRPAGSAVFEALSAVKREMDCPTVLTPARQGQCFGGMSKGWKRIAERAGFEDVTLHTLRHSFASVAGDLHYTEPTIAAMLGHAAGSVTGRYIHHLDSVLIAAADKVAIAIAGFMNGETPATKEENDGDIVPHALAERTFGKAA